MSAPTETMTLPGDRREGGIAAQVEALRRRALPMGVVFGTVLGIALLLAAFWPATYLSTGTILIEQQEIPQDFVRSAVSSYADERIQIISQRVMTSDNLLRIIDKFNVYGADRDTMTREALVERMRNDIKLQMVSANVLDPRQGRASKATIAFSVGFESRSPDLAARVANDVVSLYLSENIEARMQQVTGSAEFLASEAEKMRQRVAELEQRVATFKQQNYDRLPEFSSVNLQGMNTATAQLREADLRIDALNKQIEFLDAQLAQMNPNAGAVSGSGERLMSPADRLQSLRLQLTAALAQYTTKHPVVIGLQQEIEELERMVADEAASGGAAPDNPAYIQMTAQRREAAIERDALRTQRAQLQAAVVQYQRAQAEMPAVERDYVALLREVETEQAKYNELRQKQITAQLAQNLEAEQKGERFSLIEPPVRPQKPVRPNRPAILAIGTVAALAAAIALFLLLEAIDTRVRGRREVMSLLGVPPLAVIPWIEPPKPVEETDQRKRLWLAGGAVAGVIVLILLVHVLVKPLDVLWAVLLRRLGG